MNFGRRGGRRELLQLDLTPMIDVVFQLVLFLVLATTFKREEVEPKPAEASGEGKASPGIQVDLPRASSQAVLADKQDVNVWVSADGKLFVDDQPVDFAGLRERLRAAASADPSTLVIVKADTGVAHGVVVRVMDTARTEGLTRLAIATEDASQPNPP